MYSCILENSVRADFAILDERLSANIGRGHSRRPAPSAGSCQRLPAPPRTARRPCACITRRPSLHNPPDKALVLAADEKSQIQALDRTQPGLPMKKGRCGTMTHDYKRNGTTTLFAALNMLDGTVIGQCMPRHRHREFLRFLKTIDERTLPNLDLHIIVDNYATHKTPAVKRWLKRHSRFHLHFTPTSGSWLNMVERSLPRSPENAFAAASSRASTN